MRPPPTGDDAAAAADGPGGGGGGGGGCRAGYCGTADGRGATSTLEEAPERASRPPRAVEAEAEDPQPPVEAALGVGSAISRMSSSARLTGRLSPAAARAAGKSVGFPRPLVGARCSGDAEPSMAAAAAAAAPAGPSPSLARW